LTNCTGDCWESVSHNIEVPADLRPVGFLQLMASSFPVFISGRGGGDQASGRIRVWVWPLRRGFLDASRQEPFPEDTKRVLTLLVKQLTAIEQISTLLISNHVAEIDQIRRAEVEPGGGGATRGRIAGCLDQDRPQCVVSGSAL
jgi:hypothetical protein